MYFPHLTHIADDFFALRVKIIASWIKSVKYKLVLKDEKKAVLKKEMRGKMKCTLFLLSVSWEWLLWSCELGNSVKRMNNAQMQIDKSHHWYRPLKMHSVEWSHFSAILFLEMVGSLIKKYFLNQNKVLDLILGKATQVLKHWIIQICSWGYFSVTPENKACLYTKKCRDKHAWFLAKWATFPLQQYCAGWASNR